MFFNSAQRIIASSMATIVVTALSDQVGAVESANAPRPIPLTRPEMKEYLENIKGRTGDGQGRGAEGGTFRLTTDCR